MSRRRTTNSHAQKKRRLPFRVVIERTEPFRQVDRDEIEADCRRITNGAEFYHCMALFDRAHWHVVHFGSAHQAEAFRAVAHEKRYRDRPAPLRESPEEQRAFADTALLWGLRTGALRKVLTAYRNASHLSLMQQHMAAERVLAAYRMPEGCQPILHVFLQWAYENHGGWMQRRPPPGWEPWDHLHWVIPQEAYPHSEE